MEICFKLGGQWHCYYIPILFYPIDWGLPGPGPVNYPAVIQDAIILASAQKAVAKVSDETARRGVEHAITAGFAAIQKRAGADVKIGAVKAG
jgi:hypothetical protein